MHYSTLVKFHITEKTLFDIKEYLMSLPWNPAYDKVCLDISTKVENTLKELEKLNALP